MLKREKVYNVLSNVMSITHLENTPNKIQDRSRVNYVKISIEHVPRKTQGSFKVYEKKILKKTLHRGGMSNFDE